MIIKIYILPCSNFCLFAITCTVFLAIHTPLVSYYSTTSFLTSILANGYTYIFATLESTSKKRGNIITVGSGAESTSSDSGTVFNQVATTCTFHY